MLNRNSEQIISDIFHSLTRSRPSCEWEAEQINSTNAEIPSFTSSLPPMDVTEYWWLDYKSHSKIEK